MLTPPGADAIERVVRMALTEDAPWGDLTSQTLIPETATVSAELVAREAGVLSGGAISKSRTGRSLRRERCWRGCPGRRAGCCRRSGSR